jgi:hypothetical protein
MANTISNRTYRDKYRSAMFQEILRSAVVAADIAEVDRSGAKFIDNPYTNAPVVTNSAITGLYTVSEFTTTDDRLTVEREFKFSEHIFDFEESLTRFDVFANRTKEAAFAIANDIDKYVLDIFVTGAGENVSVAGGFTTSNVIPALASIRAKVAGYAQAHNGVFLVMEAADTAAFIQTQALNGFSMADSALKNGFIGSYVGVDLYVVRDGVLPTNHRLAGVKKVMTYAEPVGIKMEEKMVSGKTGIEFVAYGYVGAKVWNNHKNLLIDVDLSAS